MHQAAWHGAIPVASELIGRGALRSLRTANGLTGLDVAIQHDHSHELKALLSPPESPVGEDRIRGLDAHLAKVDGRIRVLFPDRDLRQVLRDPPVEVLHELPGQRVWFPVPGMYGGFHIQLCRERYLEVSSWCRVVGGSGQFHMITHEGSVLVDEDFV